MISHDGSLTLTAVDLPTLMVDLDVICSINISYLDPMGYAMVACSD